MWLTLNRPKKLNALSQELHEGLLAAVRGAAQDPLVGCVVLTGAGRAYCSGGDLAGARSTVESQADGVIRHGQTARLLHAMSKPTIAMVNGVAAGAGLALALACDLAWRPRPRPSPAGQFRREPRGALDVAVQA